MIAKTYQQNGGFGIASPSLPRFFGIKFIQICVKKILRDWTRRSMNTEKEKIFSALKFLSLKKIKPQKQAIRIQAAKRKLKDVDSKNKECYNCGNERL